MDLVTSVFWGLAGIGGFSAATTALAVLIDRPTMTADDTAAAPLPVRGAHTA